MMKSRKDEDFSRFVQSHRAELLRAARLLTASDPHRAEDLVQTALTRVYATWHRLRGRPAPYAHRVLLNCFIDQTRGPRWRMEKSVPDLPEPSPSTATSLSPLSSGLLPDSDGETVRAALAELPPKMRAVIVLRHWLDLSVQESAELLGCSQGTIKSQTSKAMAHLRILLSDVESSVDAEPTAAARTAPSHTAASNTAMSNTAMSNTAMSNTAMSNTAASNAAVRVPTMPFSPNRQILPARSAQ